MDNKKTLCWSGLIILILVVLILHLALVTAVDTGKDCICVEKEEYEDEDRDYFCAASCTPQNGNPSNYKVTEDRCELGEYGQDRCEGYCICERIPNVCGDRICDNTETKFSCPTDCTVVCGDMICSPGESGSCRKDCRVTINEQWRISEERTWLDINEDGVISKDADGHYAYPDDYTSTKIAAYDPFGNVLETVDELGTSTYFIYDNLNWKAVKGYTEGFGSALQPRWQKTYYDNGLLKDVINENNEMTTRYYDRKEYLERIVTSPDDSYDLPSKIYEVSFSTKQGDLSYVKTRTKLEPGKYAMTVSYSDGFGQVIQTQKQLEGDNFIIQNIDYDSYGNQKHLYFPFIENTGGAYTTTKGDIRESYGYFTFEKSSVKSFERRDGSTKKYYYGVTSNQPFVMFEDENKNTWFYRFDPFGNVLSAEEGLNQNFGLVSVEE